MSSEAAEPGVMTGRFSRIFLSMVAAGLILAASYIAWHAYVLQRGMKEAAREHVIWKISQAVTAYASLQQTVVRAQDSGPDTREAASAAVRAQLDRLAWNVVYLTSREAGLTVESVPEMNTLIARLEMASRQFRDVDFLTRDRDAIGRMTAEMVELLRLTEAVNQEDMQRARIDERTVERLRWLLSSILVMLVSTGLLLLLNLARRMRELDVARHALEGTAKGLRDALDAAGRADAAKARFIATVSHEIRTPMNAVMGLAEALLEDRLTPAQREMAVMIRESGGNLLRMLNDILDHAKLGAGRMTLEETAFSPQFVTETTVVTIGAGARAKGLSIVAIPAPGLPRRLLGDPGRVGQILLNLASNAVKFTETGGVSIQVLCPERDERRAIIEWIVTDTGVGIEPGQIDRLFQDFSQADETVFNRFGGTGLGLAICKRLVTQMGGTVVVESTPGEGSRFRVRLAFPVAPASSEIAKDQASAVDAFRALARTLGRPLRVLVAEDNPTNQFVIGQVLKREGIAPDIVADGRAAVSAAETRCYDIICMDMRMPEMDGLEATRAIRAGSGASATVPIIALTASAFPEDIQACHDAGMTLFVPKPVRKDALFGAMLAVLTNPHKGQSDGQPGGLSGGQPGGQGTAPVAEGVRQTMV